ncbi:MULTISPECIES: DUF3592 domain-containing protein [unclassified Streptomyces]|uniref:DUF3592 domain-containing protein n=1 Tax=unclassified Streptomyces TaxID=2593676 RepID=UPI0033F862E2
MSLNPVQMTMFWVGLAIVAAFGMLCFSLSRRLICRLRSVTSGVAVEGRCIRRYSSEGSEGNTSWHHVHAFTTLDGQYVEFEEDALLLEPGGTVTVRYLAQQPRTVRHDHGPRRHLVAPVRPPLLRPHHRGLHAAGCPVRVSEFRPIGQQGNVLAPALLIVRRPRGQVDIPCAACAVDEGRASCSSGPSRSAIWPGRPRCPSRSAHHSHLPSPHRCTTTQIR